MNLTTKLDTKKLRGGYYTPKVLADYMAKWIIRSKSTNVLEPSCGDGSILISVVKRLIELGAKKNEIPDLVLGIEIDSDEALKATENLSKLGISSAKQIIHNGDFFQYCKSNLLGKSFFDAVIGNPPFLRYQDFPKEIKEIAFELMKKAELNPIGHTNSWVPFLVVSSLLLNEKGLLCMIVPAQLFQVNYAAETRRFLSHYYKKLTIITFEKLIFQDILQDIVVLLGERNNNENEGIRVVEHKDSNDLKYNSEKAFEVWNNGIELKPLDHTKDKWTQYFLDTDEILLLRELKEKFDLKTCKDVLEVDIGVVTGRNSYFVLNNEEVMKRGLMPYTSEIIGSSSNLQGIRFSAHDLSIIKERFPTWLFKPPDQPLAELPDCIKRYINYGEKIGVNKGYKCIIRKEWYKVPSYWVPHAFMLRQIHGYPKMALNETNSTCTDTIHRVKISNRKESKRIVSAFMNSVTFAFSEVIGRSYGGGVLTLEPNEAEELPILTKGAENLDFEKIDNLERQNKIEEILNITDEILLKQGLNIKEKKIKMLRNIWKKLRNRRFSRRVKD